MHVCKQLKGLILSHRTGAALLPIATVTDDQLHINFVSVFNVKLIN